MTYEELFRFHHVIQDKVKILVLNQDENKAKVTGNKKDRKRNLSGKTQICQNDSKFPVFEEELYHSVSLLSHVCELKIKIDFFKSNFSHLIKGFRDNYAAQHALVPCSP